MNAIATIKPNMLVVPISDTTTLAEIRPVVEHFVQINKDMVFDYRDKKGNKAARSHIAMLRKAKAPVNDTHKRLTEEAKRFKDAVDKDRRELIGLIDEMIDVHSEPLQKIEAEEAAEAELKRIEQEVAESWDLAHEMNAMVDQQRALARQKAEQDRIATEQAAEQQRIQIEKDKQAAAERAAEEARLAEQARAARAIEDAERKVKEAEERAAREKAEIEAAAKAEEDRKRREEERAQADMENIKRVHWAIIPALVAIGLNEAMAKEVILAIRDGKVPAVSIDYQWSER